MITKIENLSYDAAIKIVSKLDLDNEPVEDSRILHLLAFLSVVFNRTVYEVQRDYARQALTYIRG